MSLKKLLNSELHVKIVIFFKENPTSMDSPRGIATWLGCKREETKKALDELTEAGVLNSISTASTSGYSFTQDKKLIKDINSLLKP